MDSNNLHTEERKFGVMYICVSMLVVYVYNIGSYCFYMYLQGAHIHLSVVGTYHAFQFSMLIMNRSVGGVTMHIMTVNHDRQSRIGGHYPVPKVT